MARVNVTIELAERIKELRLVNKVKAIDLAAHMEKSPAYISKLESGNIKTLDYEELLKIFTFISKDKDDLEDFIDKLSLEVVTKELDEQTWLMNFDTIERKIPIPSSLVDYINRLISDLNLTIPYLIAYINENEDLKDIKHDYNIDISKYKNNLWHSFKTENEKLISFIIMDLNIRQVENILEKKVDTSNYVTIESILYNILRLKYGLENSLTEEKNSEIKKETRDILNSHKFYSSFEKSKILKAATTKQEFDLLLNEFDLNNRKLVNEFLGHIRFLSNWNIKYTNEKLNLLNENLKWDPSYTLTLASLPFSELNDISKSLKGDLLKDIKNLIYEYKHKPEAQKTIETY